MPCGRPRPYTCAPCFYSMNERRILIWSKKFDLQIAARSFVPPAPRVPDGAALSCRNIAGACANLVKKLFGKVGTEFGHFHQIGD